MSCPIIVFNLPRFLINFYLYIQLNAAWLALNELRMSSDNDRSIEIEHAEDQRLQNVALERDLGKSWAQCINAC